MGLPCILDADIGATGRDLDEGRREISRREQNQLRLRPILLGVFDAGSALNEGDLDIGIVEVGRRFETRLAFLCDSAVAEVGDRFREFDGAGALDRGKRARDREVELVRIEPRRKIRPGRLDIDRLDADRLGNEVERVDVKAAELAGFRIFNQARRRRDIADLELLLAQNAIERSFGTSDAREEGRECQSRNCNKGKPSWCREYHGPLLPVLRGARCASFASFSVEPAAGTRRYAPGRVRRRSVPDGRIRRSCHGRSS